MNLNIKILHPKLGKEWKLPAYANPGDVGLDLVAALDEEVVINSLERKLIPSGLAISIPFGYEAQIRPRSGLALKNGITILNSPGTIDAGYRNQIGIILFNTSKEPFIVKPGDRVAQMVLNKVEIATINVVDELDTTERNMAGFGSSGV